MSYIEPEEHHIAILHDVLLSLRAHFALLSRPMLPAERDVIFVRNSFRADESFFEIGMDHTRGFRTLRSFADGPRAHFLGAGGKVCLEPEEIVGSTDQIFESGGIDAEIFEKFFC